MFCPNCGTKNPDDSAFCRSCGQSLAGSSEGGRVSDFSGTSSPKPDYEALGASYQTPQTIAVESGRKRRGGSFVIALLAVLVLLGVGAFFMRGVWLPLLQVDAAQEEVKEAESGASTNGSSEDVVAADESGETDGSNQAETVSSSNNSSGFSLVGTWVGELRGKNSDDSYCYGAQVQPLTLNVKSEDGAGKIKADITVCYHNHAMGENDIDSDAGDTAVTFSDITLTNYGGNMEYHGDVSAVNRGGNVVVVFHVKDSFLTAVVTQKWVDPSNEEKSFEYRDSFEMKPE